MFVQMFRPKTISIKLSRNDYEKYHQKYTYWQDILKDKFLQLVLDPKMNLVKPPSKTMLNNTTDEYNKLISICKRHDDFNTTYHRIHTLTPYTHTTPIRNGLKAIISLLTSLIPILTKASTITVSVLNILIIL